jgi:5'-nucleotidase
MTRIGRQESTEMLIAGLAAVVAMAMAMAPALACGVAKPTQGSLPDGGGDVSAAVPQQLLILHTNDLHSHLMGHSPEVDYTPATVNDDLTVGGVARLATAIGAAKTAAVASATPILLLDAGDFMMGTLFELLAKQATPELKLMQTLGYDATTIGNHELDWTPAGLAAILQAAATANVHVPIVASNLSFSATDPADDALKALADAGAIQSKLVKTVGTLKVGFFGLLGADAVQVTPQAAPLSFEGIKTAAARMVTELRETDKVDLVIALSHSGIFADGTGEDADLAAAVAGIDVIISGHTHDKLTAPKIVTNTNSGGKTIIVTAGAYGENLGELRLSVTPAAVAGGSPTVVVNGYTLLAIDDKIAGDTTTQAAVDAYIGGVNQALATSSTLTYKQVVAETGADLALPAYAEAPVGNLVTDAYRAVVGALQPSDPPVIAVEGNGQLRSPIVKGKTGAVWAADLFRVTPIGIGPNMVPGFPLVTFYLNAADIRAGLELGAAGPSVPDQYFLQVSGLKAEYDMSKQIFGRVSSLTLVTAGGDVALDPTNLTTCYKVVTTNYVAGLLGVVKTFTGNLLQVTAKDSDCLTPVDPTTRYVDADPTTATVDELKQWQAVLKYVSGLPDTDGDQIPNIPATYTAAQGRIVTR